jgi:hypothetical protein
MFRVIIFQFVHAIQPRCDGIVRQFEHRFFSARFVSFCSMQAFFARVDKAAWREQQLQTAEQLKEHPPPCAPTPPPKRGVGRPKLKRPAAEVRAAAAAADALELPTTKRGKYTRWFSSPYINDIIHAHAQSGGSARRTVAALQRNAPDDRFARLSHSTVASWFDVKGVLLESHRAELEAGTALHTGGGVAPVLQAAPGAEDAICDHLLQLRKTGMPLNSHVVRWVLQAVLEKHPAVLEQLTLSQQFISKWVRSNPRLQFRWRARTTAASKLPNDWEEQGIRMAQRMGATMQLHKVRIAHTDSEALTLQADWLTSVCFCADTSFSGG